MTEEEVKNITKEHIEDMNKKNPHSNTMNWVESKPLKTSLGFCFEYKFELLNPNNTAAFGGATGILSTNKLENFTI